MKGLTIAGGGLLLQRGLPALANQAEPVPEVKRALVMFKCHFDAGFIDTQTAVVHKYFSEYFPRAIDIATEQNASGKKRYVWTTGSWLLFEYLEQAAPADRARMEKAIEAGHIAWHALPFTWQSELLNPSMMEGSLALSRSLDQRFGRTTTGAKMTDVPGHTRGLIRPLADHGVTFLEIGVNGGSTPAQLPPIFLWKDTRGSSLAVMYHHEYGGIVHVPGSDLALVTCVADDNAGPHTPAQIEQIYADLAARFPNAAITACGLTEMANALAPYHANLPVITNEIGDTWIYGVPSDPLKVARFREVARLRSQWIAAGAFRTGDATDLQLLRRLLLEVEHTWGTDTKTWLDFDNYTPADLSRMLDTKNYKVVQFSWKEKRDDLYEGLRSLPENLRSQATEALDKLTPTLPQAPPEAVKLAPNQPLESAHFTLVIDPVTGAFSRLRSKRSGREWASNKNPIALISYQTLGKEDYDRFIAAYLTTKESWAFKDFGKPNIERFGARNQTWHPATSTVRTWENQDAHHILIRSEFEDEESLRSGRAAFPREVYIAIKLPKHDPVLELEITCFHKPATRLPEALWLTFDPAVEDPRGWYFAKSGETIQPFDVIAGGGRRMHAVDPGFGYRASDHSFQVETIDAPVVALGNRTPLAFSVAQPDLTEGVHSCLLNNAWGTNYIMWYGEDMRFRYVMHA